MSAVFSLEPVDEERREVRLRDHRNDPIILDLDALQDQPRQLIALFGRSRPPTLPGRSRRNAAACVSAVAQFRGPPQPREPMLQSVPFRQIRLTRQVPPGVQLSDALEPALDLAPLAIGICALLPS